MVLKLWGVHRLAERLTQVDDRRWSLQKVYRNLVRVAGSKITMLTKSDVQKYGYLRRYTACTCFALTLYQYLIGRVRPKAVS